MKSKWLVLFALVWVPSLCALEPFPILPTPQSLQYLKGTILLDADRNKVVYIIPARDSAPLRVAQELISEELRARGVALEAQRVVLGQKVPEEGLRIYLASYQEYQKGTGEADAALDEEDRQLLASPKANGQEYILWLRPPRRAAYLIGAGDQGVLWAASSFVQLLGKDGDGVSIPAVQIRDFPDFPFRMAADWLMNVEINRWSYDWGDGVEGYLRRAKRKLDLCVRYKINMVLAHGFGWGLDFFPGFTDMMRELNQYARDRGIGLVTGGYGASYGMAYQS